MERCPYCQEEAEEFYKVIHEGNHFDETPNVCKECAIAYHKGELKLILGLPPLYLISYSIFDIVSDENPPTDFGFLVKAENMEKAKQFSEEWERDCNNFGGHVEVTKVHEIGTLADLVDFPQIYLEAGE